MCIPNSKIILVRFVVVWVAMISLSLTAAAQNKPSDIGVERSRAMALVSENRYLDAYPLLEKLSVLLPNDTEIITHFGIAIAARSVTLSDPAVRKAERKRAYEILSKAEKLGTENVMALNLLDQLDPDGGDNDNFTTRNPEAEAALREGESFFGRGEYPKARAAYERAYKIDPKIYEAALFIGDTYYAEKRYAESEPWFARAVAIDRDRELAYRFWGDALMYQNKLKEATEKFIDAFVADPYSRYSWDSIDKLTRKQGKQFNVLTVIPPGNEPLAELVIKPDLLSETDGTKHWVKYNEMRDQWKRETFKKTFPGEVYRDSLQEKAAALKAVAISAAAAIKSGSVKNPHHSIVNVVLLHEKGMVEPYILFLIPNNDIAGDYETYREKNRERLRQFLVEYFFVF